jgi:hypothetical protein
MCPLTEDVIVPTQVPIRLATTSFGVGSDCECETADVFGVLYVDEQPLKTIKETAMA